VSIGEVPAAARRQAGLTITQVSQRTCIRETIIRGSKSTTSPLAAATSIRAGTSAPSLVPRAWTASRWSGSTTPATARHSPAPLPTCPGRPLPPAQAAPQAGLGRRAAGRARGLPGRCQCPNQRRQTPAGAAAFTVITGQFLGSATDYPFCSPQLAIAEQRDGLQIGGSGTQVARHQVTERDGRDGSASLLSSQAMPSFRLGEAAGQFTDVTGADQLADGRVTGRRHGPIIAGGAAAPDPPLPARSAGSPTMRCGPMASSSQPGGAEQPVLVPLLRWSSLPRSHCLRRSGQLADSGPQQGEILSLAVSCRWRQSQRGGRGSRAPVSEPARPGEPGPAVAGLSGSRTARTVPARPARQASPLG